MGKHGSRVKFFLGKPNDKGFSVSISSDPQLLPNNTVSLPKKYLNHYFPLVKEWVAKNHVLLQELWDNGNEMLDDDITKLKNSLIPIT